MGSEGTSNFYMDNLTTMGNCQYYPNSLPPATANNIKDNANGNNNHGHMNIGNRNTDMSNNTNNSVNGHNQQQQQQLHMQLQQNRWNGSLAPLQQHQHELNGGIAAMAANANVNGQTDLHSAQTNMASIAPPQSNTLLNTFHNNRNSWHFNGISGCYQRIYNDSNTQNHFAYPHYSRQQATHIAQYQSQGMFVYSLLVEFLPYFWHKNQNPGKHN